MTLKMIDSLRNRNFSLKMCLLFSHSLEGPVSVIYFKHLHRARDSYVWPFPLIWAKNLNENIVKMYAKIGEITEYNNNNIWNISSTPDAKFTVDFVCEWSFETTKLVIIEGK